MLDELKRLKVTDGVLPGAVVEEAREEARMDGEGHMQGEGEAELPIEVDVEEHLDAWEVSREVVQRVGPPGVA